MKNTTKELTLKQARTLIMLGNSHLFPIPNWPIGVSKFQVFLSIKYLISGEKYWKILSEAYTMSDNLFAYREDVKRAFASGEEGREKLMDFKERAFLKRLPEEITIYRAMSQEEFKSKKFGLSWTLDRKIADFFKEDYIRNYSTNRAKKIVHELTINKSNAIAFFNGRKEKEIIYLNHNPNIISVRPV